MWPLGLAGRNSKCVFFLFRFACAQRAVRLANTECEASVRVARGRA